MAKSIPCDGRQLKVEEYRKLGGILGDIYGDKSAPDIPCDAWNRHNLHSGLFTDLEPRTDIAPFIVYDNEDDPVAIGTIFYRAVILIG